MADRDVIKTVRLTAVEAVRLEAAAQARDMTFSEYIREAALDQAKTGPVGSEEEEGG